MFSSWHIILFNSVSLNFGELDTDVAIDNSSKGCCSMTLGEVSALSISKEYNDSISIYDGLGIKCFCFAPKNTYNTYKKVSNMYNTLYINIYLLIMIYSNNLVYFIWQII